MLLFFALTAAAGPADTARAAVDPGPDVELVVDRELPWAGGTILRFHCTAHGLPVDRAPVVVTLDRAGRPQRVYSAVPSAIAAVTPAIGRGTAIAAARPPGTRQLWAPRATLVYLVDRLAWRIDHSTATPFATWRTWVDAATGTVLAGDRTSFDAIGTIYPLSPSNSQLEDVDLQGLDASGNLSGDLTDVWSCDDWDIDDGPFGARTCRGVGRHAAPDANGDFRFAPDPASTDDPFAEVQVYHHVDRVAAWAITDLDFDLGRPIRSIVNFPLSNAFFGDFDGDGDEDLSFGHVPGNGTDFGYDADVVYHEFGHAIVDGISDIPFLSADVYGLEWAGGSLNEGTADIFSMILTGDPLMGEYAGSGLGNTAIRDLAELRRCPDDLRGEVHGDGEIWAALGWALHEDPDVGPDALAQLVYGAVATWGPDVSWDVAGQSLLDAAADLEAAGVLSAEGVASVDALVAETNIAGCGRVLALDDGRSVTHYLWNAGLKGDYERMPIGVQFSLEIDGDAEAIEVDVAGVQAASDQLGWTISLRRDAPVEHEAAVLPAFGIATAIPRVFDLQVDGAGAGTVRVDAETLPALTPGTWYIAVSSRNLGGIPLLDFQRGKITLSAQAIYPEEDPKGGCSCSAGGSGGGLAALLAFVAVTRRRGRSRASRGPTPPATAGETTTGASRTAR